MKFNITVEYDPFNDWDNLEEMIKDEVVQNVSNQIFYELTSKFKSDVFEAAKKIKQGIANQLANELKDQIVTDSLIKKIEDKAHTTIERSYIKNLSDKMIKQITSEVEEMVKNQTNKAVQDIKKQMNQAFRLS